MDVIYQGIKATFRPKPDVLFDATFDVSHADAANPLAEDAGEEDEEMLRDPVAAVDAA